MKENELGNTRYAFIKSILHILLKSHTQNYHPTSLRRRMVGWEVYPTTLFKFPKNWVIWIEKGGSNNFDQVTTILRNLYWKHRPLIKKW